MTVSEARRQSLVANRAFREPYLGKIQVLRSLLLLGSGVLAIEACPVRAASTWDPYPPSVTTNDFGGVGLIQTPTARFAPDGQVTLGGNRVNPYERYFFTVQGLPWFEATLRLTTVRNRLYSPFPEFSGDQSYKDRGFDLKLRVVEETSWTPAVALGLRDFVGTGLFSSEYVVLNKRAGAVDISLGLGWGNLASRGLLPNPFSALGSRFDTRGAFSAGGGTVNNAYFKGRRVAPFGGVKYDTPIEGLALKIEYDSNDYKSEALQNRFRVSAPVNVGVDYAVRSWLHVGAAFERGNKIGVNLALTTNYNRPFSIPKFDPPAPPVSALNQPASGTVGGVTSTVARPSLGSLETAQPSRSAPAQFSENSQESLKTRLSAVLSEQGAGFYAANFEGASATIYVGQWRFQNMAQGLGRVSRAAFSVLPPQYTALTVVFVEGGVETIAARLYRNALIDALTPGVGSTEELYRRTEFTLPPLQLDEASVRGPLAVAGPSFSYSVRPSLKTTIGRPEQFILYQAGVRLNGYATIARGLNAQGSFLFALSDNFDKLQIPSDSQLPHVRSDIKEYLREGKTSIPTLHANYTFNIAPAVYGHVYAGLLEEMFAGVGGEILYRPSTSNWAIGADLTYAKQRSFQQLFGFRDYSTITGFVTGAYHIPGANIDVRAKIGRYLAKDYGGTLEIARTFDSGVVIGAFATKTNVSAERFGEGRFDKGIYLSVPLNAIFSRNTRGSVGLLYRPLIRDGGQMLSIPQPLLMLTDETIEAKFKRDWAGIDD